MKYKVTVNIESIRYIRIEKDDIIDVGFIDEKTQTVGIIMPDSTSDDISISDYRKYCRRV